MADDSKKMNFAEFFTEGHYQTQTEVLEVSTGSKQLGHWYSESR